MVSLGGIGAVLGGIGSLMGARSQDKANRANEQANREFQQQMLQRQDAGTRDPFGTTVSREGGGPLTTTLSGPVKQAADIGAQNVLQQEQAKLPAVQAGGNLLGQIAKNLPPPRQPVSLDQARGIVAQDDDAIKNAILNPAIQDASALALRTRAGMSNAPNLIRQFQERILPQIKLGGETRAMDITDKDWARYASGINQAEALMREPRYAPTIPGTSSIGEIAQAGAMLPKPQPISPSYTGTMGLMGAGNVLSQMQAAEDHRQAQAANTKFQQALLNRLVGDQPANTGAWIDWSNAGMGI